VSITVRELVLAIMNTALKHSMPHGPGPAINVHLFAHPVLETLACSLAVHFKGRRPNGPLGIDQTVYVYLDEPSAAIDLVNLHSELRALIDEEAAK